VEVSERERARANQERASEEPWLSLPFFPPLRSLSFVQFAPKPQRQHRQHLRKRETIRKDVARRPNRGTQKWLEAQAFSSFFCFLSLDCLAFSLSTSTQRPHSSAPTPAPETGAASSPGPSRRARRAGRPPLAAPEASEREACGEEARSSSPSSSSSSPQSSSPLLLRCSLSSAESSAPAEASRGSSAGGTPPLPRGEPAERDRERERKNESGERRALFHRELAFACSSFFLWGIEKKERKKKNFFFVFSRTARQARHSCCLQEGPSLSPSLSLSRARELLEVPRKLKKKNECGKFWKKWKRNERIKKMKKLKKQKPLSQSLLSLQFTASPHLSAAPAPSKEEGRSIKIHAKEEEGETPERKKEEKTPLFLSFSLSLSSLQPLGPLAPALPLDALRRLVPRRVLQDRLEQLRASKRVGERQVPLGSGFRLQGGSVVELSGPLAVDVELALDPVDRLEELVPPGFVFGKRVEKNSEGEKKEER
jgi:hypothetical protein